MMKKLMSHDHHQVMLTYDAKRKMVTLGGNQCIQEKIYKMYLISFGECDGDPEFYTVVKGKCRIQFKCSFSNLTKSLSNIESHGYDIYDVTAIGRDM